MTCSQCGTTISDGQVCCNDQLTHLCPNCNTPNPSLYKFCGDCGQGMHGVSTLLLDHSGLIQKAHINGLELFPMKEEVLIGKPFSLFVNPGDLARFFSHWNEIKRSAERRTLEIELNLPQELVKHVKLILNQANHKEGESNQIQIKVIDIADHQVQQELQNNKNLIDFIVSLSDTFHHHNENLNRATYNNILEKISSIASCQYAFLDRYIEDEKRIITEFVWSDLPDQYKPNTQRVFESSDLEPILHQLEEGRPYSVMDVATLGKIEKKVLQAYHYRYQGAIFAEMIFQGTTPVGIIGIAKANTGLWPQTTKMLVKLAGILISQTLPTINATTTVIKPPQETILFSGKNILNESVLEVEEFEQLKNPFETDTSNLENINQPSKMEIIADTNSDTDGCIPLFTSNRGNFSLICPTCERQETVSVAEFKKNGWSLKVTCPCSCNFRIIHEMRMSSRKDVQLQGEYKPLLEVSSSRSATSDWDQIEVTNLSKFGLNFSSRRARLLDIGDRVRLRLNLGNSNWSPTERVAEIKSIRKDRVGCKFLTSEGDNWDTDESFVQQNIH